MPFALASLGIAGAWVGKLNAFAAYKWPFVALSAGMIGYGFYTTRNKRSLRAGLWIAAVLAVSGIVFEQIEPFL